MNETRTVETSGWVTYAGVLLAIGGIGNLLWGFAALKDSADWGNAYPLADSTFVGSLELWGWLAVAWAIVLFVAAALLLNGSPVGRPTGIVIAALSIVFWLAVMPAFPLFALTAVILAALALYGLSAHWSTDNA